MADFYTIPGSPILSYDSTRVVAYWRVKVHLEDITVRWHYVPRMLIPISPDLDPEVGQNITRDSQAVTLLFGGDIYPVQVWRLMTEAPVRESLRFRGWFSFEPETDLEKRAAAFALVAEDPMLEPSSSFIAAEIKSRADYLKRWAEAGRRALNGD